MLLLSCLTASCKHKLSSPHHYLPSNCLIGFFPIMLTQFDLTWNLRYCSLSISFLHSRPWKWGRFFHHTFYRRAPRMLCEAILDKEAPVAPLLLKIVEVIPWRINCVAATSKYTTFKLIYFCFVYNLNNHKIWMRLVAF